MLEKLKEIVEQYAGSTIVNNAAIPTQHKTAAIQEVAQQIFDNLKNHVTSGNLSQLTSLFKSDVSSIASHPIVTQMVSSVAGGVASKFGVSSENAQSMASNLIPNVVSQVVSKTNDSGDSSFDLGNMVKSFAGDSLDVSGMISKVTGGSEGIGGMLGKLF